MQWYYILKVEYYNIQFILTSSNMMWHWQNLDYKISSRKVQQIKSFWVMIDFKLLVRTILEITHERLMSHLWLKLLSIFFLYTFFANRDNIRSGPEVFISYYYYYWGGRGRIYQLLLLLLLRVGGRILQGLIFSWKEKYKETEKKLHNDVKHYSPILWEVTQHFALVNVSRITTVHVVSVNVNSPSRSIPPRTDLSKNKNVRAIFFFCLGFEKCIAIT